MLINIHGFTGKSQCRLQKSSPTQNLPSPRSSPARSFKDTPTKAPEESPPPPRVPKNSSPTLASPERAHKKNLSPMSLSTQALSNKDVQTAMSPRRTQKDQ